MHKNVHAFNVLEKECLSSNWWPKYEHIFILPNCPVKTLSSW